MILRLRRFCYAPEATFGLFEIPGEEPMFSVERPWLDNAPFQSCVPEGTYRLRLEATTTPVPESYRGKTWYLEGGTVGLDEGDRTRIAIHVANTPNDVAGCIGLGLKLGTVDGQWAVITSRLALEQAAPVLAQAHELEIYSGPAGGRHAPDDEQYRA